MNAATAAASVTEHTSPLVEIERRVQARAKDIALDMSSPTGLSGLRRLIDDELVHWAGEYRRGLRPFDLPNPEVVAERAFRN